ncbi:hypothetical protein [Mycolicibacterium sp. P9-64]|uniref:hypothetical protein n=1 Tax=Mycolicibacterium sp. P9-64 TaxID=2024612 RepID=UPI001A8DEB26|nr:hypothetical protein [Mycolicibacterium sp. P9-64]
MSSPLGSAEHSLLKRNRDVRSAIQHIEETSMAATRIGIVGTRIRRRDQRPIETMNANVLADWDETEIKLYVMREERI